MDEEDIQSKINALQAEINRLTILHRIKFLEPDLQPYGRLSFTELWDKYIVSAQETVNLIKVMEFIYESQYLWKRNEDPLDKYLRRY